MQDDADADLAQELVEAPNHGVRKTVRGNGGGPA